MLKKIRFLLTIRKRLDRFWCSIYQMIDWYLFSRKIHSKKLTKMVTETGQKWHFSCFLACFRLCQKMAKISVKNKVKSRRKLKINKKMLRPIGYSMISNNVWKKKNWENNVKAGGVFLKKRIGTQKFFLNNSQKKKKKNAQNFFWWFFFAPSAPEAPKSKVQSPIVIYIRHIEWFISCTTSRSGRGSIQASSVQKAGSLGRCASGADANYVHSLNWFLWKKTSLKGRRLLL